MGVGLGTSVTSFLDELASREATPGGGSAAALTGALAAALGSMVGRLTVGKKGYEEVQEAFRDYLERTESLREDLQSLVEEDAAAFEGVMAAFRMARETEEETAARGRAIQQALKTAAEVPMDTAQACGALLGLLRKMAPGANRNAISDVGSAAHLTLAGLRAASLNVRINLASIQEADYVKRLSSALDTLTRRAVEDHARVIQAVEIQLG